jgi:flagellar hook-associated protein 1 FlgK
MDSFLGVRLVEAQGDSAYSESLFNQLSVAETLFDEDLESSMANRLSAFWDSLEALTLDPSDTSIRAAAVGAGEALTGSVANTASYLTTYLSSTNDEIEATIASANQLLEEVASLNTRIAQGVSSDQLGAGDLLDQRDMAVMELAELIGVTADFQADGQATVFLGGHAILMESNFRSLEADVSALSSQIYVETGSGRIEVTEYIGGSMGAATEAQENIQGWLEDLDTLVIELSDAFNTQHQSGFDSDGNAGGDFFTYTSLSAGDPVGTQALSWAVDADLLVNTDLLALAGAATAAAGDGDNLDLLIALQDQDLFSSTTLTSEEFLARVYSDVGIAVANAEISYVSHSEYLNDLNELRTSMAGVDLDEEAVMLLQYQAAYQASAKVVTIANEVLETLMNLVR